MNTRPNQLKHVIAASLLLAGVVSRVDAQSIWNGSTSTDWETAANWSAGVPSGVNAQISTASGNIATISNNFSVTPVDIQVGWTGNGRVDHISGNAGTGDGNWMWMGIVGNQATYNFADTATTGGTFTGFGQGSGNLNVGGATQNGNLLLGLDNGTVSTLNVNSSGTISGAGLFAGAAGGSTGIVNMDGGAMNFTGEFQIGANFFSQGSSTNNKLNMSGGTITANILSFSRGANAASVMKGAANITGGTLNSRQWFTLGFAGSATAFAAVTNNGGTINVNTNGGGNLEMGVFDPISTRFVQDSGTLNIQNNGSIMLGVLGNSGAGTFDHNGGSVTFFSDAGTTVGGTGSIILGNQGGVNPWEISSGTYNYNLNGGTLRVPAITKTSPNGSGSFNLNGGTLKPTASTTTFLQGITAANVKNGGAIIDTDGFDITIAQGLLNGGTGGLSKLGAGILTLSGNSTYVGDTTISAGSLALSGNATLVSKIIIPASVALDVTALTTNLQNPVAGLGGINGNVTGATGLEIIPATDGTAGSITFSNDLNLVAGGTLRLDLSTSHLSGNDQVIVAGNLNVSASTIVRIKALSGAANLSQVADYVLCAVSGTTTLSGVPSLAWDGTTPANYLSFSVATNGNNLVLRYTAATAPTVTAVVNPTTAVRNQAVTITATVTPGTGSVTNVFADISQIGGSSSASLVLSATPNVYTNTFSVTTTTSPGSKTLTVVAQANTGLNSPGFPVGLTVVIRNEAWDGGSAVDNNWTSGANWTTASPAASGDSVTFAGVTRLTPDMDSNFSVTGVAFDATAGSFTVGTSFASTLTLASGSGVVNNSANTQTLNVPILQSAAQTYNAAAGNLVIANSLDKGGNLVTVTGAANTTISGTLTGSGSLYKRGSGSLTLPGNATWDLGQASSGGFNGPFIAQSGTVTLNSGSSHTVTGELVVGGVIANGGTGNDAAIVVDSAALNISSWLSIGRGNGTGTVSSVLILTNGGIVSALDASAGYNGGSGLNKPKGTLTLADTSLLTINNQFHIAEAAGADFTVNVNGTSTLNAGGLIDLAIGFGGTVANLNLNGGTVNGGGDVFIGHWGDGNAALNINSGAFNVGTSVERWMFLGYWDRVNGQININGGSLNFWNNSKLRMARNVNHGGNVFAHVINHNAGDVRYYSDAGTTEGGTGLLDMQYVGAAQGSSTYNLNGGTLSVPSIVSSVATGNRTFNFNGGTLKAGATGTLMDLGAGNAHAYVRTNGAIIDDNGNLVTIVTALEHFSGDATDGGLRKLGAGTLNLTGANSYKGNTTVAAGILQIAQATLASTSTVIVSNAALLQLDFATTNHVSALVLNGVAQPSGVYNNGNTATYILGTGSLLVQPIAAYPTNITSSVSGNTLTLDWPSTHLGWVLQGQTNNLATGINSNWADLPGTGSVTSTTVAIDPLNPTVFFRLRHP